VIYDTQTPYAASYVLVRNTEGLVAFVLRSNTTWMNNYYGLPSGKTEKGESFMAGAVREAKEEIGIDVNLEDLEHAITVHRYSTSTDNDVEPMEWVDVYFEVKKWDGVPINAEPHIHSELAWLDPKNLPDNTIHSVVAAINALNEGKKYLEYGYDDVAKK
jgi:8-oxo-dGTP pyrophosphatase MutT (NUDIX family)